MFEIETNKLLQETKENTSAQILVTNSPAGQINDWRKAKEKTVLVVKTAILKFTMIAFKYGFCIVSWP